MPWRLRFAGAILAFAGILLALSGREIQSQSNSPTNNSPTNSVPQPPPSRDVYLPGLWDAIDCADCDTIYDEKITDLTNTRDDAIDDALEKYNKAIADASKNYKNAIELENAIFNGDMAQVDADFLHAIKVECSGWALGGAFASRQAASYAGKAVYRKIKYTTIAILRNGFMLIGGVFTTATCVNSEQEKYDATTEALMAAHNAKIRQIFEEWRQALADAKATRDSEIRRAHAKYNRHKPRIDRQYRNCKRFFNCEEDEGTNNGDCGSN